MLIISYYVYPITYIIKGSNKQEEVERNPRKIGIVSVVHSYPAHMSQISYVLVFTMHTSILGYYFLMASNKQIIMT